MLLDVNILILSEVMIWKRNLWNIVKSNKKSIYHPEVHSGNFEILSSSLLRKLSNFYHRLENQKL